MSLPETAQYFVFKAKSDFFELMAHRGLIKIFKSKENSSLRNIIQHLGHHSKTIYQKLAKSTQ